VREAAEYSEDDYSKLHKGLSNSDFRRKTQEDSDKELKWQEHALREQEEEHKRKQEEESKGEGKKKKKVPKGNKGTKKLK